MTKVTLNSLSNLQNENTAVSTINGNSTTIVTAFDNTLSRDGTSPNQMGADLDMNSHNLLNVKNLNVAGLTINGIAVNTANLATLNPVTDGAIFSNISGSTAIPTGNTLSQILDHTVGTTQGSIITRTATGWNGLSPGASGTVLHSNGPSANLDWVTQVGGGNMLSANNLSDVASASTSRTNLGATSIGNTMFTATTGATAQSVVGQYDTVALAAAAIIPTGTPSIKISRYATGYPLSNATYIPGTSTGSMAFQDAGGNWWNLDTSGELSPELFGAKGDGVTDDGSALNKWAVALSDGGLGKVLSKLGYATSQTITFMPSTNVGPVQGPRITGKLKLIGHANLPIHNDLLHIWNPTAVTTSQNFYYPTFDSIEVSNTTGVGCGVSVRGFWGKIGEILGRNLGRDVLVFPQFLFGGIPDEYESMPTIGNVTGIDYGGWVVNNQISIGASPILGNLRGTQSDVTKALSLGCLYASGGENCTGCIAYTGYGAAVRIAVPYTGFGATPHEVFMQGCGDIDVAQYGYVIENLEFATLTGHRINVEPPGFVGIPVTWPVRAFIFGKAAQNGRVVNVTVNAYMSIRPGVTAANVGSLFDFSNDPNINNLVLNVSMNDQVGFWAGLPVNTRYPNRHPTATIKIFENGVQVV